MDYTNPRYLELADQIENHSRSISYLKKTLEESFPTDKEKHESWQIYNHRPVIDNIEFVFPPLYGKDSLGEIIRSL